MEDGVTRTDAFQTEIALPEPMPRYQVTFELNGGMIVPDGGNNAQDMLSVQVKAGREVNSPVNEPTKDGYIFKGWYTDSALTTEAVFPVTITKATMFYAMWEQDAVKVKYAVSIYGIQQDTDEEGNTVGLTFGPATGESYVNTYKSHTPSAGQMCIHDMTWEEIIAQSAKDPSVFRECLENGCTHSVELTITGKLAEGAWSYSDMVGDRASVLHKSIAYSYKKWNREHSRYFKGSQYTYGTNQGGWRDSAIRNTLNGVVTDNMLGITNKDNGFEEAKLDESTALISCFPTELKLAIVPKRVTSRTDIVTYDKLWLFSAKETFGNSNSGMSIFNINEGSVYERITSHEITISNYVNNIGYNESNYSSDRWLRSTHNTITEYVYYVTNSGRWGNTQAYNAYGLAPGFCLPGPKPSVKYAVSLYGIEHDTYSEDDGATEYTAGLTFGPATGASYVNSYVEHEPTGVTASGNAHRCIHKDSWTTIAEWSKKDPYVYEQCYGDEDTPSCTKAVPLYLNSKLKATSYSNMSGDGAGVLCDSITSNYRKWNREKSTYFSSGIVYNWGTSEGGGRIRQFGTP